MVKFLQVIHPGDKGRDVKAVKRALGGKLGYHGVSSSNRAGVKYEHALRSLQSRHKLPPDGLYGPKTHEIVALHFDRYGDWLYRHAKLRHHSDYVNPFAAAHVEVGRVDMGVDYHGWGPIHAIGDGFVFASGGLGWPGGEYLLYRLGSGRHAGRFVYIAEGIIPSVRPGQPVKAGQEVCRFRWDAAPGMYPGIEFGWGSPIVNLTWAAASGQPGGVAHSDSPAGLAFARFLKSVGAPAPDVGAGPEFP